MKLRVLREENGQIRYSDFRSALILTDGKLVSNREAHEAISNGARAANFEHPLWTPFWTRTIIAYPESCAPFGEKIESADGSGMRLVMDTSAFKGMENCAIVFDDFKATADGNSLLITPAGATLVHEFPQHGCDRGSFAADSETGIPIVNGGKGRLALWRNREASIVPVVRATHNSCVPALWLRHGLSSEFGMVVRD